MTNFKQGQNVRCVIIGPEKDGYAVTLLADTDKHGYLKTANKYEPGDLVLGVFVCIHNGRYLFSQLFSQRNAIQTSIVNPWKESWEELLTKSESADKENAEGPNTTMKNYLFGYSRPHPGHHSFKRACDLLVPPLSLSDKQSLLTFQMFEHNLPWLIENVEGNERTGCIKVSCEDTKSRALALFYRGRVVGCACESVTKPVTLPTRKALKVMLTMLQNPETKVTLYDLPENIILPMSSLFLGFPLERNPNTSTGKHIDHWLNWFAENNSTACLAVTGAPPIYTNLAFINRGKLIGVYDVENQKFSHCEKLDATFLDQIPTATCEASLHSPNWQNGKKQPGYRLKA